MGSIANDAIWILELLHIIEILSVNDNMSKADPFNRTINFITYFSKTGEIELNSEHKRHMGFEITDPIYGLRRHTWRRLPVKARFIRRKCQDANGLSSFPSDIITSSST